ncbi:MAG: HDIG domain-containing protein [Anaerolineales bacterium]|nr:HDIG domain-containing protein [Anaerolineales bacterium]
MIQRFYVWIFAALLFVSLAFILSLNAFTREEVDLQVGDQATEEIVAPRSLSYISNVITQRERELAIAEVGNIYQETDRDIGRTQRANAQKMFGFIDVVRADNIASIDTKLAYLSAISFVAIEPEVAQHIVELDQEDYEAVRLDVLRIIQEIMQEPILEGQESRARQTAAREGSFDLTPTQEQIVTALAPPFVVANTFFDEEATTEAKDRAAAGVQPVERTFTAGQPIVEVGDIVDAEDLEALEQFGFMQPETDVANLASGVIAAALVAVLIALYLNQFHLNLLDTARYLFILTILFVLFTLGAKLLLPVPGNWTLLFPTAALSMLIAVIFDIRMSVLITVMLAILVGYIGNNSLELAVYAAAGGLMSILTLRDADRLNAFFRAGLLAATGNLAVVMIFRFALTEPIELAQLVGLSIANGLIAAGLTLIGFFVVGSLFGVITTMQLQDLSRLDHPLLQELLRRAPGTYHHSIMVANLAEQGAERISANATLVRVGAFYHDIGKTARPPFFTENQDGVNPHDSLSAESSARIIINHVSDGLEMARQHRLPQRIQDFIAEHHGSRVVWGFYRKAIEEAGGDESKVERERFKYMGPRPQTRETAIVMLSDAIDATAVAIRPNTESGIVALVSKTIDDHVQEGQLDDSGLTLGDIQQLRESFIETLKGRFHVRVRYPGNEELVAAAEEQGGEMPALADGGAATPAGTSPTPDAPESADAEAKPVAANGAEPIPSDVPEAEIVSEDAA